MPAAGGEVVIEFPGAASGLQARYETGSSLLRTATVESDPKSVAGPRIRLGLGEASLETVEQTDQGVLLRFVATRQAPPGRSVPRPGDYRIGSGDKLEITVFGHEDMSRVVEVRADGTINFPLIGDLRVAGRTASEVNDDVTVRLRKDYLVDPQVGVEIREYQSHFVTIIGEVRTPGRYVLKRNMRLIDLLAESGGVSKEAGPDIVITRRVDDGAAPRTITVDREQLMGNENQEANIILADGDIVVLGEKGAFYIRGEVARPGSYFLEKGMTVLKAISVAGGFTQFANRKEVELLRAGDKGVQEKSVINLRAIESGKKEDVPLRTNDTVIVPRRIF